jgi:hypothetical protein
MQKKAIALTLSAGALLISTSTTGHAAGTPIQEWGTSYKSIGLVPTPVQSPAAPVQIDAANHSDLVVMSDATVWGWGATQVAPKSMQLVQIQGLVNVIQRPVDGNMDFAAIEQPGSDPSCPTSSSVYTWGVNTEGSLGLGISGNAKISVPKDVTTLDCRNVVDVAAAANHMVALTQSGQVYVWGGGGQDVLGDGHVTSSVLPVLNSYATALTSGTSAGVLVTAGSSTGGMLVNGQAYSWGNNKQDECGCNSTMTSIGTPTAVDQGALSFAWIDQGGDGGGNGHTLALTAAGAVYAWGMNSHGQLGQGTTVNSGVPLLVPGLPVITDVRAGGFHSLALDAAGNVWAWGGNTDGEIGNGSTVDVLSPILVLSGATQISAGSEHSLALQ